MPRIMTGRDITETAIKICKSDHQVYLAVAFWSGKAAEALGVTEDKKIRVVLDVNQGGTSAVELADLIQKLGSNVRVHNDLHAKVYAAKDSAIVGSANASRPGLHLDDKRSGHAEAAVVLSGKDAKDAFDLAKRFWKEGETATKKHVAICTERFGRMSIADVEIGQIEPLPFLQAVMTSPDQFTRYPFIVTCKEASQKELNKNWREQKDEIAPGEATQKYDHSRWDSFSWRLDTSCEDRLCIALHRDPNGGIFAGLVRPVLSRKGKWTFARRISWSEVRAVKGARTTALSIKKNEHGRAALEQLMLSISKDDAGVVQGYKFIATLKRKAKLTPSQNGGR